MDRPLVSIIVRTKDRPKLLTNALRSLTAQTHRPLEVIVVNDGGCRLDQSNLQQILEDVFLVYVEHEQNKGRAAAGNTGISRCRGRYVGFLDDDDQFYSEHIRILADYLTQSDLKIVYSDSVMAYQQYNPNSGRMITQAKELIFSQDFNYSKLLFDNYIPLLCLLFDRQVLVASGGFDPAFELYEDHDLLLRIGESTPFHHIAKVTAEYNQWCPANQIAQAADPETIRKSQVQLFGKHLDRFTPERIHQYRRSMNLLKNARIRVLEQEISDKDARINDLQSHLDQSRKSLQERDQRIAGLEEFARVKEAQVSELTGQVYHLGATVKQQQAWNTEVLQGISEKLEKLGSRRGIRIRLRLLAEQLEAAGFRFRDYLRRRTAKK